MSHLIEDLKGVGKSSEHGIIVVILAIILSLVVSMLGWNLYIGASSTVRTQVQTAADAAAFAAAKALCSSTTCWNDSVEVALRVLAEHKVLQTLGAGGKLILDRNQGSDEGLWELPEENIRVLIQRGRYLVDDSADSETFGKYIFQEMEGSEWFSRHPGIPPYVAANAVHVEVTQTKVTPVIPLPWLGNPQREIQAGATALAGPIDTECVAPFAIPVCALLDRDGEFRQTDLCYGDRIFTRVDRYCPSTDPDNPNATYNPSECGRRPAFFYGNYRAGDTHLCGWHGCSSTPMSTEPTPLPANPDELSLDVSTYGWYNPAYINISDHFGVVGLPSDGNVTLSNLETQIVRLLEGDSRCVPATVGQDFLTLADGLTGAGLSSNSSSRVENAVWNAISNPNIPTAQNRPGYGFISYQQYFTENGLENPLNLELFFNTNIPIPGGAFGSRYQNFRQAAAAADDLDNFTPGEGNEHWLYNMARYSLATTSTMGICPSRRATLSVEPSIPENQRYQDPLVEPVTSEIAEMRQAINTDPQALADWNYRGRRGSAKVRYAQGTAGPNEEVWEVKIPVIASVNSDSSLSCEGIGETEAAFDPLAQYEIIGFLNISVLDVAIGSWPTDPTLLQAPFEQSYFNSLLTEPSSELSQYVGKHGQPNSGCGSNINCSSWEQNGSAPWLRAWPPGPEWMVDSSLDTGDPNKYPGPNYQSGLIPNGVPGSSDGFLTLTGPNPWWFTTDNYWVPGALPTEACNLVRARVSCENNFIPSSINAANEGPRLPIFVDPIRR